MTNYDTLVKYVIGKHNVEVAKERAELMILYYGGILANACNHKLYNMEQDKVENINFFGMMFMDSSAGKDFLKSVTEVPFKAIMGNMPKSLNNILAKQTNTEANNTLPKQYQGKKILDYEVSIGSSDIGLYILSLVTSRACVGSVNVAINEFGDIIGKTENVNMLKEMYDGTVMAAFIQGKDTDDTRPNVYNVPVNMIAYGTPVGIKQSKNKLESFKAITQSGLYRRSLIYYEMPRKQKMKDVEHVNVDVIANKFIQMVMDRAINTTDWFIKATDNILTFDPEANDMIEEFRHQLFDNANDNLHDELIPLDRNAHKVCAKIAAIISIINEETSVSLGSVRIAIDLFNRTRMSVGSLFEQTPVFELIYLKLSTSKEPLLQSDLIKKLGISKKDFDENIKLVDEYSHRFNKKMSVVGSSIVRYWIADIEMSNIDKMIVSTASKQSNKPEMEINFKSQEVGFFGDGMTIESLVKSDIQSYCLNHFEPTDKAQDGHRKKEYVIQGQNMIAFDIDEGLTLVDAKEILSNYIYIIYTTKSHQKEKNGIICDRFRVILPTKTKFYVNAEQHKQLYENISSVLEIPNYDVATRNQGRLWFTNKIAEVDCKREGDMLDVRCCIPETETAERVMPNLENLDLDEEDRRLSGMIKYTVMNGIAGERNDKIFRLAKFVSEIGRDMQEIVHRTNQMLNQPLPDGEVNTIIRNIR